MIEFEGVQVLDAAVPEQRQEWLRYWMSWPRREIFAHPSYVSLYCGENERALCLAQRTKTGGVVLPLIQRRLDVEPWVTSDHRFTDLVSPYGYGGAFFWGEVEAAEFWRGVAGWARETRAVSCFMRLSVFDGQVLEGPWEVEGRSSNVVRDLDPAAESLWMDFEHKVRKNVKRAQRAGLEIVEDSSGSRLADFRQIYIETMDRRTASEGYYFPASFFTNLVKELPGQFCFFHCCRGDEVVSTELVLVSERTIYSFLGGTLESAFPDRPNDLLKHHIILWGKAHHKSSFVLGGGFGGDDGIFRYKRSFAPNGVVQFQVGTWIVDMDAYNALCQERAAWERRKVQSDWEPSRGFFPAYRG